MKLTSSILLAMILACVCSAQTPTGDVFRISETVRLAGTDEEHHAKLAITTGEFQPARHRITRHKRQPRKEAEDGTVNFLTLIDNRRPLGTGGDLPVTEIRSMVVTFDGKSIVVPKKFYSDCYNPNFNTDHWGTKLSDNGKSLLVFMAAGQGKSRYQLMWILRQDRQHARFLSRCSECDQKGVLSFFSEK